MLHLTEFHQDLWVEWWLTQWSGPGYPVNETLVGHLISKEAGHPTHPSPKHTPPPPLHAIPANHPVNFSPSLYMVGGCHGARIIAPRGLSGVGQRAGPRSRTPLQLPGSQPCLPKAGRQTGMQRADGAVHAQDLRGRMTHPAVHSLGWERGAPPLRLAQTGRGLQGSASSQKCSVSTLFTQNAD
jgi:hypothetical protein